MESYENIYKTVCRVCLNSNEEENIVSLIDNSSSCGLSCYGKAIMTFANVVVKSDDIFPVSMCKNCICCLKQAIYFKLKCESSDKQLKKLAEYCYSDKEMKEKIVEFTMFSSYFTEEDLKDSNSTLKRVKSQAFIQKITGHDLDVETAVSQDSLSDNFLDNSDCNAMSEPFEEKPSQIQEDCDIILDRIENLIGSHSNISSTKFKRRYKKKTHARRKKIAQRQLQLQTENETFICNVCHRVLANKHSYENHMQRHNGCRYVCEHCGKGFPVLAELKIHQVAVHGTGPYLQCRHCPYKAPRKFSLVEHERIHTGERPYTCEKCGLTFRRRFIWKKHLIYHKEKTVQCSLCPRKFYQRSEMLAHCNNVHERVYVYLCNKCGATYAKPATVRRHLTERHGVPREMQGKVIRINKSKGDFPE